MQADAPVKADERAARGGEEGDYGEECPPMESSDIVYAEVHLY